MQKMEQEVQQWIESYTKQALVELSKESSKFLASQYVELGWTKEDLHGMNSGGVEVPVEVLIAGDIERAKEVHDPKVKWLVGEDMAYMGVTAAPRDFFSKCHRSKVIWTEHILRVLAHLGLDGTWTREEINMYIHGSVGILEYMAGNEMMRKKLYVAWLAKKVKEA